MRCLPCLDVADQAVREPRVCLAPWHRHRLPGEPDGHSALLARHRPRDWASLGCSKLQACCEPAVPHANKMPGVHSVIAAHTLRAGADAMAWQQALEQQKNTLVLKYTAWLHPRSAMAAGSRGED